MVQFEVDTTVCKIDIRSASNMITNKYIEFIHVIGKSLQERYCKELYIPNIGIILISYGITTYFNNFNSVIHVSNMYYVLSKDCDLRHSRCKLRKQFNIFYVKCWPEDDLNVSRNTLPYTL